MGKLKNHGLALFRGRNAQFVTVRVADVFAAVSAFGFHDSPRKRSIDRCPDLGIEVQSVMPLGIAVYVRAGLSERPSVIVCIYAVVDIRFRHADVAGGDPHAQERIGDMLGVVRKWLFRFEVCGRLKVAGDLVAEPGRLAPGKIAGPMVDTECLDAVLLAVTDYHRTSSGIKPTAGHLHLVRNVA